MFVDKAAIGFKKTLDIWYFYILINSRDNSEVFSTVPPLSNATRSSSESQQQQESNNSVDFADLVSETSFIRPLITTAH